PDLAPDRSDFVRAAAVWTGPVIEDASANLLLHERFEYGGDVLWRVLVLAALIDRRELSQDVPLQFVSTFQPNDLVRVVDGLLEPIANVLSEVIVERGVLGRWGEDPLVLAGERGEFSLQRGDPLDLLVPLDDRLDQH